MEFVDHDPAAARRAATACRDAAEDLRVAARLLDDGVGPHLAAWAGDSRVTFDDAAADLAADLRAEAIRLEDSADEIDASTRRAYQADALRRRRHLDDLRRRQQAADQCTPAGR